MKVVGRKLDTKNGPIREDHSRAKLENKALDRVLEGEIWEIEKRKLHTLNERKAVIEKLREAAKFEHLPPISPTAPEESQRSAYVNVRPRTAAAIEQELQALSNFGKRLRTGKARNVATSSLLFDEDHRSAIVRAKSAPVNGLRRSASAVGTRATINITVDRIDELSRPRIGTFLVAAQLCAAKLRARSAKNSIAKEIWCMNKNPDLLHETENDRLFREETKRRVLDSRKQKLLSTSDDIQTRIRKFCWDLEQYKRDTSNSQLFALDRGYDPYE